MQLLTKAVQSNQSRVRWSEPWDQILGVGIMTKLVVSAWGNVLHIIKKRLVLHLCLPYK